jgi:hypothetical protein
MAESMPRFILYGTLGCHLCELAEAQLATLLATLQSVVPVGGIDVEGHALGSSAHESSELESVEIECIDVSIDDRLLARYGERIPVLQRLVDNAEINWPFEDRALREFLQY